VLASDTVAAADGEGWELYLLNFDVDTAVRGTLQVVCLT
jgi:hypothetical protein